MLFIVKKQTRSPVNFHPIMVELWLGYVQILLLLIFLQMNISQIHSSIVA